MQKQLLSTVALALALSATGANANDLQDIPESETVELQPGSYTVDEFRVGANATVHITGDTEIFADSLVIEDGARFIVESNGDNPHFFTLRTFNGLCCTNPSVRGFTV